MHRYERRKRRTQNVVNIIQVLEDGGHVFAWLYGCHRTPTAGTVDHAIDH